MNGSTLLNMKCHFLSLSFRSHINNIDNRLLDEFETINELNWCCKWYDKCIVKVQKDDIVNY